MGERERPTCPRCGGVPLRIVYGEPGSHLARARDRGELVLGGCVIEEDAPDWACPRCGLRF
jgi:hypothetical protein